MSNENYVNHYVEILTSTMTDAVIRNISLQANARISEEVIADLNRQLEGVHAEIGKLQNGESAQVESLKSSINEHLNTITRLNGEIANLNNMRNEFENTKNQIQHVNTFRNELVKAREEHKKVCDVYESRISELNEKIEYLQLTPAKRKKIDDEKAKQAEKTSITEVFDLPITQEPIKDGGSF